MDTQQRTVICFDCMDTGVTGWQFPCSCQTRLYSPTEALQIIYDRFLTQHSCYDEIEKDGDNALHLSKARRFIEQVLNQQVPA
jgi:hypothetical protein